MSYITLLPIQVNSHGSRHVLASWYFWIVKVPVNIKPQFVLPEPHDQ